MPDFPVFLLSGLLAWNLFSASLLAGLALRDRQRQPREEGRVPAGDPAARRRSASPLVDFVLQSAVLLVFIVVSGHGFRLQALVLYPLAFVTLLVFTTAMTFWVSALNVRYRDVQHLLNLGLLVWFWMTPIVYQAALVQDVLVATRGRRREPVEPLPAEPAHPDRARVPAGALRRPGAGRRSRCCPTSRVAWQRRACSAIVLRGLDRCCCCSRGDCSSGSPATSRRSCDRRDRGRGRLEALPALPRAAEQREAAPAGRRASQGRGLLGAARRRRSRSSRARRSG